MNRRQHQRPFVGIDGQDAADAVVGRFERHVAQQTFEAAIALGHALKMFHVSQTLGMIVGIILLQDRHDNTASSIAPARAAARLGRLLRALARGFAARGRSCPWRVGAQPLDGVAAVEQPFDDLLAGAGADAFEQHQDAVPRNRVLRIGEHPHMREQIFDMGGFHELKAAALDERNVMARQLDFQIEGMKARTEQHGDVPQRHALLAQLQNLSGRRTAIASARCRPGPAWAVCRRFCA